MKAWKVDTNYSDCQDIVFANNKNVAKMKLLDGNTLLDSDLANDDEIEYIDIRANRIPELDDSENKSLLEIAEFLILKLGWNWSNTGEYTWNADNFEKEEFEKEFLEHWSD